MDIQDFIIKFAETLDDIEVSELTPDTYFKELDEWSSLASLSIIAMVDEEYDIELKGAELRSADTIQDLFDIIKDK